MDIEKLIQNLRHSNSPVSLNDFTKIAVHFGFTLDHSSGSHHVFRNWTGKKFSIPVHNKKIKHIYLKNFLKDQE